MRRYQRRDHIVPYKHICSKYYYAQHKKSHIRREYFYFRPVLSTDVAWIHLKNQTLIN